MIDKQDLLVVLGFLAFFLLLAVVPLRGPEDEVGNTECNWSVHYHGGQSSVDTAVINDKGGYPCP